LDRGNVVAAVKCFGQNSLYQLVSTCVFVSSSFKPVEKKHMFACTPCRRALHLIPHLLEYACLSCKFTFSTGHR
jgi:hypothetical protein